MPDEITIDGVEEMAFRRSIETMLRNGSADEALDQLKGLIGAIAGDGKILPARMLEISPADVKIGGWDKLAGQIESHDRPESRVTAIGIGIADPMDVGVSPDENGQLAPQIETAYFSDSAYPFSDADRDDLLEGYSAYGCEWQGNYEDTDTTLAVEGMDDLYGAIATLENKVGQSSSPDPREIEAGAIGACYLGVLVFIAMRDSIVEQGLPRPMSVLLINSDAYPFFDAPVMTADEYLDSGSVKAVAQAEPVSYDEEEEEAGEMASLSSLVGGGLIKAKKKMALELEGEEAGNPLGMADELVAQAAFEPDSMAGVDPFAGGGSPVDGLSPPEDIEPQYPEESAFEEEPEFPEEPSLTEQAQGGRADSLDATAEPGEVTDTVAEVPAEAARTPKGDRKPLDLDALAAGLGNEDDEDEPDAASPIDFGKGLDLSKPIDFGALGAPKSPALPEEEPAAEMPFDPLRDTPDNFDATTSANAEDPDHAPRTDAWLDDWQDVTGNKEDVSASEPDPSDANHGKWTEDWKHLLDDTDDKPATGPEAPVADNEKWAEDWADVPGFDSSDADSKETAGPVVPETDFAASHETDTANSVDAYDFHKLEEEFAGLPSSEADMSFADGPYGHVPAADTFTPASHSLRSRIRIAAEQEEEASAGQGIWARIVDLFNRIRALITRS